MKTTLSSNHLELLENSWALSFMDSYFNNQSSSCFLQFHDLCRFLKLLNLHNILSIPLFHNDASKQRNILNAFCHTSFANEFPQFELDGYQRLEFLGDAVLDLMVTEGLFEKYPEHSEGYLSRLRGSIVNEDSLARLGTLLGLQNCILVGKGELKLGGLTRKSMLADVFEALIGAIYLNEGIERVTGFWQELRSTHQEMEQFDIYDIEKLSDFDSKTRLQEITMKDHGKLPTYEVRNESSEEFEVKVIIEGKVLGQARAKSKRVASQQAAKQALNKLVR